MSDIKTRFGGVDRLYGNTQSQQLYQAHFCVVGIGGVGTWAAEALARTGIGQLTLIDLDDICTTNTNRQIHAMSDTVGMSKVDVMAARIKLINPACQVNTIEDFVTQETLFDYITPDLDFVIDAIDSVASKAALLAFCKRNKIRIITTGGAGGQIDPTKITYGDLSKTIQDPLAAKLRNQLRRFHGFPINPKRKFSIECVYSTEQLRYPTSEGGVSFQKPATSESGKLDCQSGFGASVCVTGSFGFFAASRAINKYLLALEKK